MGTACGAQGPLHATGSRAMLNASDLETAKVGGKGLPEKRIRAQIAIQSYSQETVPLQILGLA